MKSAPIGSPPRAAGRRRIRDRLHGTACRADDRVGRARDTEGGAADRGAVSDLSRQDVGRAARRRGARERDRWIRDQGRRGGQAEDLPSRSARATSAVVFYQYHASASTSLIHPLEDLVRSRAAVAALDLVERPKRSSVGADALRDGFAQAQLARVHRRDALRIERGARRSRRD